MRDIRIVKLIYCWVCGEKTVHCETEHGDIRCEICGNKRFPSPFSEEKDLLEHIRRQI